jgi:hypothetical protein
MSDTEASREDRIRLRAYQIWLDAGCPDGAANEHWLMAETEEAADEKVDMESEDSFPASDPPSQTATVGPD